MKTKKIHIWIATLFLSVMALNEAKAAGVTYTLTANTDPSVNTNWTKIGSPTIHPSTTFTNTNATYSMTANPGTMNSNWTITANGSVVIITSGVTFSDNGNKFSVGVTGVLTTALTVSAGATLNVSGTGTVTVADIFGTATISGASNLGNTTVESGALVTVSGAATLSGVNPISGTLTIANASASLGTLQTNNGGGVININQAAAITSATANNGGVINFNVAMTIAQVTANSGGIINFNAHISVGSSLTSAIGSTYVYNSAGSSIVGVTYGGNVTVSNTAQLVSATQINGILTLNDVLTLNNNLLTIGGTGTIAGASTITSDVAAGIAISSSASVGTLNFTSSPATLGYFDMSGATGSVTLGSDLTISDDGSQTSYLDLSGGTISLNGKTLTSDVTCTSVNLGGTITGSSSSILSLSCDPTVGVMTGTLNMDQTTTGTSNALSAFTMNDGGMLQTISLGNEMDIIDSIVPTAGTIDVSVGLLKLVYSSTTKTGRVGMMGNNGAISGSNVNTSITRPGGSPDADWCLMGYPGIIPGTQDFTWLQGQIIMQCPNCPDGYYYGFSSVQTWDETTGNAAGTTGYAGINNTTDAMNPTQGYWFYLVRSASLPITVTGSVKSAVGAGITFNLTNTITGYNLINNPVPSGISWSALRNGNASVNTTYAVYNPQAGAYEYYDEVTGPTGSLSDVIAPGQGLLALVSANTSMTLFEHHKTGGGQALLKGNNYAPQSGINYFKLQVDGNSRTDKAVFEFNSNATTGYDMYDAKKMAAGVAGVLQISSYSAGDDYAINAQPGLTQNYSIPVKIVTGTTDVYQITPLNMAYMPAGACVKLHDNYTGIDYDLSGGPFSVTLNDTETVARFMLNITITPLQITANATQATCHSKTNGYITAVGNNAGPWNYTWKNASNTVVKTTLNSMLADTLTGLNNGVYSVDVTTVGSCDNATQTFTLTAPGATTSAFTASSMTVNVNNNVTFTDNSVNADTYSWNFGDGNTSNIQNPVYAYAVPGNYNVQFTATNSSCNESAVSNKTITVLGTTSIAGAASSNDEVVVGKDAAGSFVKFNYTSQTKVTINVYNALGQFILSNASLPVYNDKIYLNLDNAKDQTVFISINNLDKNTQVTKKLFNN
ncbi:MAG: beta strand repeat-containing protein [Bacteroidia bacterium]